MNRKLMHILGIFILLAAAWFFTALSGCKTKGHFGREAVSGPEFLDESEIRKCLSGIRIHEDTEQYYRRGRYLQKRNRHNTAIREFQTAVALNPGLADALNAMGISLDALGRYPEAMGAYRKAVALDPDRADILNNLGWSCLLAEDVDAAVDALRKAVSMDGENNRYWNNLGLAHAENRDFDAALDAFLKTGDEADARIRLAGVLTRNGLEREARDQLRLAAALRESPPAIKPAIELPPPLPVEKIKEVETVAPPEPETVSPLVPDTSLPPPSTPSKLIEEDISAEHTSGSAPPVHPTVPPATVIGGAIAISPPLPRILEIDAINPPDISLLPLPGSSLRPAVPDGTETKLSLLPTAEKVPAASPAGGTGAGEGKVILPGVEIAGPDGLQPLIGQMAKKLAVAGFAVNPSGSPATGNPWKTMVYYREGHLYEAWDVAKAIPGWQDMKKVPAFERPEIKVRAALGRDLLPIMARR